MNSHPNNYPYYVSYNQYFGSAQPNCIMPPTFINPNINTNIQSIRDKYGYKAGDTCYVVDKETGEMCKVMIIDGNSIHTFNKSTLIMGCNVLAYDDFLFFNTEEAAKNGYKKYIRSRVTHYQKILDSL